MTHLQDPMNLNVSVPVAVPVATALSPQTRSVRIVAKKFQNLISVTFADG